MVDDDVLLADGGEAVAAVIADALGEAGDIGLELQIAALVEDQLSEVRQAQHAVDDDEVGRVEVELIGDELAQVVGHRLGAFHVDDAAAAAALEQRLEQQHQVFGFFLHFDIAVAQHAEDARADDLVAGEELLQIEHHDFFERQEAHRTPSVGQADEALQLRRDRHQRGDGLAVLGADQARGQGEAEIGDEGKGMRRIDGERGQHRENLLAEMLVEPGAVGVGDLVGLDHRDAGLAQLGAHRRPHRLLVGDQQLGHLVDLGDLLRRGQAVGGMGRNALLDHALEARDADHEELVEVGSGDRQKAQALEQRMAAVARLREDAAVEGEPGELAVDETRGRSGVDAAVGQRLGGERFFQCGLGRDIDGGNRVGHQAPTLEPGCGAVMTRRVRRVNRSPKPR